MSDAALDDIDRRLIALLRQDARLPVSSLAQHLAVSRGTVQNRIDRLVKGGTIQGFTLRLAAEDAGDGIRAMTLIHEKANRSAAIVKALGRIPEARAVHTVNGKWDLLIEVSAPTLAALDRALSLIRAIDGVEATETLILLTAQKL